MRQADERKKRKREEKSSRTHIPSLAFLLASLLIAVTTASLVFVGYIASEASQSQAIQSEHKLFENTLNDRVRLVIREALPIARSDEAINKIVLSFNIDYVRDQLGKLWSQHSHNRSLLVSSDKVVLAESFEGYTHIARHPLADLPSLMPLMDAAQRLYERNRVRVPGGYSHRTLQDLDLSKYSAYGLVTLDHKPAVVGILPLMPDEEKVQLPDEKTVFLVTVRFLDAAFIRSLNTQIGFKGLSFIPGPIKPDWGPNHFLLAADGEPLGSFVWQSEAQSNSIWPTVIPVILMLGVTLAALALLIAWRIGRLTHSLQASERQNRYLALHDTLSGLPNRLYFNRILTASLKALPGKPFAILHCDLDHFKTVNDTHGHGAGDIVIKEVARRMQEILGRTGVVSRVGGDEFIVIIRKTVARAKLEALASALIQATNLKIQIDEDASVRVGLSVGIAIARFKDQDLETLLAEADRALYTSKEAGRGLLTFSEHPHGDELKGDELAAEVLRRSSGKEKSRTDRPKAATPLESVDEDAEPSEATPPAAGKSGPNRKAA
ncbi:GGDEF domain-containing protein [Roseibium suaedae]|uniref:Diguanylate cyclase (GGDEF) domain-containing protein n=1 Tax=Roseibium suaedae TaxID=735517 RepID=A0A1M7LP96_9HYPH|nr:GGDEF domain-containing protein [Roseibium suaedae]SHM80064.1 diguanylate cyclase (GGDEF) domain-containing protein [Roseibium suaedae]